jgi:hypothetical protein
MVEWSIGFYDCFALFSGFLYYSYGTRPLYIEVVLIQTHTECYANECTRFFFDHGFPKLRVPADLDSDRDTIFTSHYWEQLCERLQIHWSMSSA